MSQAKQPDRVLRFPEVRALVGNLSRSTIWRRETDGTFPRSFRISRRAVGWLESDIERYIAERRRDAVQE